MHVTHYLVDLIYYLIMMFYYTIECIFFTKEKKATPSLTESPSLVKKTTPCLIEWKPLSDENVIYMYELNLFNALDYEYAVKYFSKERYRIDPIIMSLSCDDVAFDIRKTTYAIYRARNIVIKRNAKVRYQLTSNEGLDIIPDEIMRHMVLDLLNRLDAYNAKIVNLYQSPDKETRAARLKSLNLSPNSINRSHDSTILTKRVTVLKSHTTTPPRDVYTKMY
ncbi:MAG: hypothetical protein EOP34_07215 [Rickettsiales bacterium]|nr:MAG: hypothetical protein EOP34_07215 [Rickettsiales bacterium]